MKNQKKDQSRAGMVDVSQKNVTQRRAVASCTLTMSSTAFQKFLKDGSPKGDVLETAKVAGIMAAKATSQIIPLCHPLELSKVNISFALDHQRQAITTTAQVVCWGRTGVEMEALTAVSVAALTIYDMMKWADKTMIISAIQLLHKSGGKQGTFDRS
jgi:cyclic pyranopterin phosphate synthase